MFIADRITNLTKKAQTPRYGKLRDIDYDRGDFVFLLEDPKIYFTDADPIGTVKLRPGEPIHIGYRFALTGPMTSIGIDTVRAMEIAIDDFNGEIKGHPIKISGQDTGCGGEGGQMAATKLAAEPSIVAVIGPNCSSAAEAGVPILWEA
jgi:ABC-type branched-subunit amino acid transport system substrate-binding protein